MPLLQITAAPPPASGCCLLGPMGDSGNGSKRGRQRQPPGASAGSEAAAEAPGQDRRPQGERPSPPGSAKGGAGGRQGPKGTRGNQKGALLPL
jgi:hypothetical protein